VTENFTGLSLTIVVCAAGPAGHALKLVTLAQSHGWSVDLVCTPAAFDFVNAEELQGAMGRPLRTEARPRMSDEPRSLPDASAIIVAPGTFNTVNKLAVGISDNHALTMLAEAIGRRTPIVIVPFVNSAFAARRPFARAVADLRNEGVRMILGDDDRWVPHAPGTGSELVADFPWSLALDAAEAMVLKRRADPGVSGLFTGP
jgi:phosphopantothenoylcysteine synthetase/decarboxylase